ncbi:PhzF family phenazine biosynthesis isomerase [Conexibacter arvalis]|uniref:Trans-2,3-dihydro-3-hydroxyanthranilate isomerase n=1 Tax=Conexibacter arvalis TaxID=912552 RepID=A0A840IM53_9ACTN|nr:trans-2,3-dihydro-3-hydroxyanthranilate isomerase [Conexibacter arvalis]
MASHRYTLLDVFTATPLEGNGLAVVHDADGLDDATMLAFARETRLSETTFVQTATDAGADYRNRIWTVELELPFAGHPSLGTAVAVARANGLEPGGTARYVQQTGAGLQPIDVTLHADGDRAYASMLQEPAIHGAEVERAEALAAIGLTVEDGDPALPPQVVSTGVPHLMLPLRDRDAAARAVPDYARLDTLLRAHGAVVLYAAACDPRGAGAESTAHARSFAFSAEIGEDPATGSAAGPLCAYLHARTGSDRLAIDQGVEMGRASRLDAAIDGDRVRVGGDVVVLVDGTLRL